eukprot:6911239-Heterocapsa_arctica.AAC.1
MSRTKEARRDVESGHDGQGPQEGRRGRRRGWSLERRGHRSESDKGRGTAERHAERDWKGDAPWSHRRDPGFE